MKFPFDHLVWKRSIQKISFILHFLSLSFSLFLSFFITNNCFELVSLNFVTNFSLFQTLRNQTLETWPLYCFPSLVLSFSISNKSLRFFFSISQTALRGVIFSSPRVLWLIENDRCSSYLFHSEKKKNQQNHKKREKRGRKKMEFTCSFGWCSE